MNPKVLTSMLLSILCGVGHLVHNRRAAFSNWIDKDNSDRYAALLLKTTYYQQGYCGAKVEVQQVESERLFIVDPGEPFRLNVAVTGLHDFDVNRLMEGGPKTGEVFYPSRVKDWAERIFETYAQSNGPLESITWRVDFDYARALANVEISVKERN